MVLEPCGPESRDQPEEVPLPGGAVSRGGDPGQDPAVEDEDSAGHQEIIRGPREPRGSHEVPKVAEDDAAHPQMRRLAPEKPHEGALDEGDFQGNLDKRGLTVPENQGPQDQERGEVGSEMGETCMDKRGREDPEEPAAGSRNDRKLRGGARGNDPEERPEDHGGRRPRKIIGGRLREEPLDEFEDLVHASQ